MKSHEASAEITAPRALPAWITGERLAWLAVVGLVGTLVLVRRDALPGQELLLANPLALVLFAVIYILIRIREADGRF
ncbi:MAG: hypothetical protein ACRYG6_13155 [Janthinobacterium lividum]